MLTFVLALAVVKAIAFIARLHNVFIAKMAILYLVVLVHSKQQLSVGMELSAPVRTVTTEMCLTMMVAVSPAKWRTTINAVDSHQHVSLLLGK